MATEAVVEMELDKMLNEIFGEGIVEAGPERRVSKDGLVPGLVAVNASRTRTGSLARAARVAARARPPAGRVRGQRHREGEIRVFRVLLLSLERLNSVGQLDRLDAAAKAGLGNAWRRAAQTWFGKLV
ncbi:hypothetical protein ColTof4_13566 [Colletotrichum tofieldiae]|nr:hypothetical protein ColTof3_14518 [Colletotrichum tofieldiae]GKT81143.1 hypothetical protein ColTof4_13566 [Colletotrichum tofieldiae]GKT97343.1 hypothetical protein Ct61P_15193 [Colletotrichum tofieldiae]